MCTHVQVYTYTNRPLDTCTRRCACRHRFTHAAGNALGAGTLILTNSWALEDSLFQYGCARLYTLVQHTEVVGRIALAREHELASHPSPAAGDPRCSVSLTASLLCTGRVLVAPAHPPTHPLSARSRSELQIPSEPELNTHLPGCSDATTRVTRCPRRLTPPDKNLPAPGRFQPAPAPPNTAHCPPSNSTIHGDLVAFCSEPAPDFLLTFLTEKTLVRGGETQPSPQSNQGDGDKQMPRGPPEPTCEHCWELKSTVHTAGAGLAHARGCARGPARDVPPLQRC